MCFTHACPSPALHRPKCSPRGGPGAESGDHALTCCPTPAALAADPAVALEGCSLPVRREVWASPVPRSCHHSQSPAQGSQVGTLGMTLGMTLEASWLGLALLAHEGGEANTARPKHPLSDGTVSLGFPGAARPLTPPPGAQPEGRHILSQSTPIREGNPLATAHADTQWPPEVIVASLRGASWLGSHWRFWSLLRGQHPHTVLSPPGCGSPPRTPWLPGLGHPGDSEDPLPHPERLTCGSRNQTVAGIRDGGGWGPGCHQVKYQPLVPVARQAGLAGVAPSSGAWRLCGEAPSSQGPSCSLRTTHRSGPSLSLAGRHHTCHRAPPVGSPDQ